MIPIVRLRFLFLFLISFSVFGQQSSIYTHELKEFDMKALKEWQNENPQNSDWL